MFIRQLLFPILLSTSTFPFTYSSLSSSSTNNDYDKELYCSQGFGNHNDNNDIKTLIKPEQINDGYCDCPKEHGIDETLTDACSGSQHWTGIPNYYDKEKEEKHDHSLVSCPQQPNIKLSSSKINDSICDCCDGYDENQNNNNKITNCSNNCEIILAKERKERQELTRNFQNGYNIHQIKLNEYNIIMKTKKQELQDINDKRKELLDNIQNKNEEVNNWKINVYNQYHNLVPNLLYNTLSGITWKKKDTLVKVYDVHVLKDILISICQLYGERIINIVDDTNNNGDDNDNASYKKSCLPLQLAGLDMGIIWSDGGGGGGYQDDDNKDNNNVTMKIIANEMDEEKRNQLKINAVNVLLNNIDSNGVKKKLYQLKVEFQLDQKHTGKIMKESEHYKHSNIHHEDYNEEEEKEDDYDDYKMDHDDDDDDDNIDIDEKKENYYLDDDHYDDELIKDYKDKKTNIDVTKASDMLEHQQIRNLYDSLVDSSIGRILRQPFVDQAITMIEKIDNILSDIEGNDGEDSSDAEDADDTNNNMNIDPMGLPMVRNSLKQKMAVIEKGKEIAQTSKTVLDILENDIQDESELIKTLKLLVAGTIYHSEINADDIIEVLHIVNTDIGNIETETCFNWYYSLCDQDVSLYLLNRCKQRNNNKMDAMCNEEGTIPSHIPEGYYNFYPPTARKENDYFAVLFQSMKLNDRPLHKNPDIVRAERSISKSQTNLTKLDKTAKPIRKLLDEENKYGPDGILYSIRDECFDVLSNKYTYEVCMFGKATQREGSNKKGSGTGLGSWDSFSMDETTGTLTLKWTGGQKCWNGPQRSATVYVTCGEKNKLLSADEPNICEYELKMESFIACNDEFKRHHNIVDE